jgi:hypothetical protein
MGDAKVSLDPLTGSIGGDIVGLVGAVVGDIRIRCSRRAGTVGLMLLLGLRCSNAQEGEGGIYESF